MTTNRSNYEKCPVVDVPGGAGACVAGWDAIAVRLREAIDRRGSRRTVLAVECYAGVAEDDVLFELKQRLAPKLVLRAADAILRPGQIDALVAPFLGGDDPVFGFLSGLVLPQFFDSRLLDGLPDPPAPFEQVHPCGPGPGAEGVVVRVGHRRRVRGHRQPRAVGEPALVGRIEPAQRQR